MTFLSSEKLQTAAIWIKQNSIAENFFLFLSSLWQAEDKNVLIHGLEYDL